MEKLIILIVMILLAGADLGVAEEREPNAGNGQRATTVKSSKSNSSERIGATTDKKNEPPAASESTTVKSSKSNTND
jgi:hypothetical protein